MAEHMEMTIVKRTSENEQEMMDKTKAMMVDTAKRICDEAEPVMAWVFVAVRAVDEGGARVSHSTGGTPLCMQMASALAVEFVNEHLTKALDVVNNKLNG